MSLIQLLKSIDNYDNQVRNYDYYLGFGLFMFIVMDTISTYAAITILDATEQNVIVASLMDTLGLVPGLLTAKLIGLVIILYAFYINIEPVLPIRDLLSGLPVVGSTVQRIRDYVTIHKARTLYSVFLVCVGTFAFVWNSSQVVVSLV